MSTSSTTDGSEDDPVAALERAAERLADARAAVAEFGETELERLRAAHEEFTGLLTRYEEPATGDGDFEQFIRFQGEIADLVERLDDDLLLYETFAECDDYLQQRRLSESDFAHVRDQLAPVADIAGRLDERDAAEQAYREARNRVRTRDRELGERIDELERLVALGEADLSAPTGRLREPIERYNETVREAVTEFKRAAPAREVLGTVADLAAIPMVGYEPPPAALLSYVREHAAGTEPVPTLLEYADYSRSKLAHYVDDPGALQAAVASRRTYLRRLDGEALTVSWPPPPAGRLRYRCRELTGAVNRVSPAVVESLRAVAALPRETDFERLREAAVAASGLSETERRRVTSGAVERELRRRRDERERVRAALAEYPG